MTELVLKIDGVTERAIKASMRLRRQTPTVWLQKAIEERIAQDVARVPPIGTRKGGDDHEAFAALVDYVMELE